MKVQRKVPPAGGVPATAGAGGRLRSAAAGLALAVVCSAAWVEAADTEPAAGIPPAAPIPVAAPSPPPAAAQDAASPTAAPSTPPAAAQGAAAATTAPAATYYREAGSYGTRREADVPRYVRNAARTGVDALAGLPWLDLGLDFRGRYELRSDDLRRNRSSTDNLLLLRTRAYLGIHDVLDPLRLAVEVEDARSANGQFRKDSRDVNGAEPIQAYAELYFRHLAPADPRGRPRPLRVQAGRMWFEKLDRRLLANNAWRNTTNTFQGFYASLGEDGNDWQVEAIAAAPLDRKLYEVDRPNEDQWFYAAIGHWRRWSEVVTIEPYYLLLDQERSATRTPREIHFTALRLYGPLGAAADYDVNLVYQTGRDDGRDHRAFGAVSELGYTFAHAWKPRWSVFYGYADGDEHPSDNQDERFDRGFGFGRPWSANDYFVWENLHAPKTRVEFAPRKDLRVDVGYSAYWLASDTDRWVNANLRDPTGTSGDFLGHEFDLRARYTVTSRVDATLGYAHFEPGGFTRNQGRTNASDFLYVEISVNAFPALP